MSRISRDVEIEEILELSNGGLDVYENELGKISFTRNLRAPWRNDSKPSLRLKWSADGTKVNFVDYGGDQSFGNCFHFIMKLYDLSFQEAKEKIKEDLGIEDRKKDYNPVFHQVKKRIIHQEPTVIDFEDCKFEKKHKKYWNKYLLPEDYLRANDVYAVKKFALNKKIWKIDDSTAVFAYWEPDTQGVKILQIGPKVTQKWINTMPNTHIWRLYKIHQKPKQLWLIKSLKDCLVMNYHFGYTTASLQNESAAIYLEHNADRVEALCSDIVCCFGADPQGVEQSQLITAVRGYKYFNTPKNLLQYDVEDPADAIAEFGVNILRRELIKKGFLNDLKRIA